LDASHKDKKFNGTSGSVVGPAVSVNQELNTKTAIATRLD